MKRGWRTTPTVLVVATSGTRLGLPPVKPLYWVDGLLGVCLPIGFAMPAAANCARQPNSLAASGWSVHGSIDPSSATKSGLKNSWIFGARDARLYEPRKRISAIGANSADILYVSVSYFRPLLSLYHDLR